METNESVEMGMNRTGVKISPLDSKKSAEGAAKMTNPPAGNIDSIAQNRIRYMREAEPIGTVPLPGNVKGVLSAIQEKIMSGNHTFMDKVGERLAFERSGVRLYEALITKHKGSEDQEALPDLSVLERFCSEEKMHFELLSTVMEEIGGDATAMTPSADLAGVTATGWVQALTDPRTSFKQCLEIILQAELVDHCCWEVLIELAEEAGLAHHAVKFQKALDEETLHLSTIKEWVRQYNVSGNLVSPTLPS